MSDYTSSDERPVLVAASVPEERRRPRRRPDCAAGPDFPL
jgi:hypothetical protein